jgi:amidophosphoribosyltransferase
MKQSVRDVNPQLKNFEASCFDGVYITGDVTPEYLDRIERERLSGIPPLEDDVPRNQMSLHLQAAQD